MTYPNTHIYLKNAAPSSDHSKEGQSYCDLDLNNFMNSATNLKVITLRSVILHKEVFSLFYFLTYILKSTKYIV